MLKSPLSFIEICHTSSILKEKLNLINLTQTIFFLMNSFADWPTESGLFINLNK